MLSRIRLVFPPKIWKTAYQAVSMVTNGKEEEMKLGGSLYKEIQIFLYYSID